MSIHQRHTIGRRPLAALVVLAVALTACGNDDGGTADAGPSDEPAQRVTLRVGDQNKGRQLPFELSGQDEGTAYDIEWVAFTDGPNMNAALTAGQLDIGSMGDSPAIFATAARADIVVVGGSKTQEGFYGLVTSPGSDIETLEDLEGKRIALTFQTAFHGVALQALDSVGLGPDDVTLINVPVAAIATTVANGDADVATLNGALLTTYLADNPTARIVPHPNEAYSVLLATNAALDDAGKREAIIDFVHRFALAGEWVAANEETWIQENFIDNLKQSPEVAAETYRRAGPPGVEPVDEVLIAHQREQARLFIEAGVLPSDFDVDAQFDESLADEFSRTDR